MRRDFGRVSMIVGLVAVALGCPIALGASGAARARIGGAGRAAHPKRGVASSMYLESDPAVLTGIGASWAYDWSSSPPAHTGKLQWVPMVWGSGSLNRTVVAELQAARRAGRARDLLGFNEPDSSSQSDMTPDQAAALWPDLERTGLRLGSPAPAVPGDGWLARFMALARARRLRVDFIALHFYQDFTAPSGVSDLRRQLIAIHRQFHKPIWITEVGALDIRRWHEPMQRTPNQALAVAYMRNLFSMLDGLWFVQRYAWFTDNCWNDEACRFSSLVTPRGRPAPAGSMFKTAP